jgi:hypothetical protein
VDPVPGRIELYRSTHQTPVPFQSPGILDVSEVIDGIPTGVPLVANRKFRLAYTTAHSDIAH